MGEQSEPFTVTGITLMSATVSVQNPKTFASVAVIIVLPVETEVASPWEPATLLMVATDGFDELQVDDAVMS